MHEQAATAAHGLWSDAGRRLTGNRIAFAALAVMVVMALFAVLAPHLSPWGYDSLDWEHLALPPGLTAAHWFGTDRLGRDLFVRTLYGVRLSLFISVLASLVSLAIGVVWGAVAGLAGGRTDGWMMRFVDVLYSLPYLFIVIILTTLWQRGSIAVLLLALGAVGWLTTARIVRGQALALVYATLTVPQMIVFESFLSFLGLGVQEPHASLGNLILVGAQEMESAPWMLLVPAAFLVGLLICLNFLGDGLRDAFDPRER